MTRLPFADNAFDAVLCIEVIEHAPKESGASVLAELERVARKQVIVSTTNLPIPDPGSYAVDENEAMLHHSAWTPADLAGHGYTVYGMYPRFTRASAYDPVYFLSYLLPLERLVRHRPERAKAFTGVKRLGAAASGGPASDLDPGGHATFGPD